jgi:hypothetical protein
MCCRSTPCKAPKPTSRNGQATPREHRTGAVQPVHRQRDQSRRPARFPVRPDQSVGVLIGRHRRDRSDTEHGRRSSPPDDTVRRHHRAPPSSANSLVRRHWLLGALDPRKRVARGPIANRRDISHSCRSAASVACCSGSIVPVVLPAPNTGLRQPHEQTAWTAPSPSCWIVVEWFMTIGSLPVNGPGFWPSASRLAARPTTVREAQRRVAAITPG